jgi:hypothetical protein
MKDCTRSAKVYVSGVILTGLFLLIWNTLTAETVPVGNILVALLAGFAQIFKVEGPTERSNYNISWVFYGFSFLLYGTFGALFVILVAHLMEWIWHRYPWYIQTFNVAVYSIAVTLAAGLISLINPSGTSLNVMGAVALVTALASFTLINHFLVGLVIKLARGQSFKESGVFEGITLVIDATLLGLGVGSAIIWQMNPYLALLNIIPVYLLYNSLRVPAMKRKIQDLEASMVQVSGD